MEDDGCAHLVVGVQRFAKATGGPEIVAQQRGVIFVLHRKQKRPIFRHIEQHLEKREQ